MTNSDHLEGVQIILRAVDFEWTTSMRNVWQDYSSRDIDTIHGQERKRIISELEQLKRTQDPGSPLGMVIIGEGGSGKTHLLRQLRRYAISHSINFILVDMTDVRDFWETVLQGYIKSLQEEINSDGMTQAQHLLEFLINLTNVPVSLVQLAQAEASDLKISVNALLTALAKQDRSSTLRFQDVLRALVFMNSDDLEIASLGTTWLQGMELEADDKTTFKFLSLKAPKLSDIVEGLSWLLSLAGPTLLAFDQLDPIVTQSRQEKLSSVISDMTDEQRVSRSIVEEIGSGLSALRDKTNRTLVLVSCVDATWGILGQKAISTFKARYHQPMVLETIVEANTAEQLVLSRLQEAYRSSPSPFSPPYPTWPYAPEFFASAVGQLPRHILKRCDDHLKYCLAVQQITELHSFEKAKEPDEVEKSTLPLFKAFDRRLAEAKKTVDLAAILDEQHEDSHLGILLQTAGSCLIWENPTPDNVDGDIEVGSGGKNYPPLHVRVRLTFRDQGDLEKHLCLRALQRTNAKAYQTRLKAAMTAAGIDRALSFRQLAIVRTEAKPGGAATQALIKQFEDAGGLFLHPTSDEVVTLAALQTVKADKDPYFEMWLQSRRPVSQLTCMQGLVSWLFGDLPSTTSQIEQAPQPNPAEPVQSSGDRPLLSPTATLSDSSTQSPTPAVTVSPTPVVSSSTRQPSAITTGRLPVGVRLIGQQTREIATIPLADLAKHVVVLASSGSGKTVLVRRLTEEAVLQGIPAIVIDCANDLARMGDRWDVPPESWHDDDRQKADLYHQTAQVMVWTPGRESGKPLNLNPLPDFSAVANSADELNQAIDMARDSLQDIVAAGQSATAKTKRGILRSALAYFADTGGGSLEDFIELLAELPLEASGGISNAQKKAQDMSDLLKAELSNNPLLRQKGTTLDPAMLFGTDQASHKTRISVINFIGLPGLDAQRQFLNQLFMTLFTWIKKNPPPPGQSLRGLLVLDEAKDFVPAQGSTPCKASLNRLAAQARKYGLGLILATQAPKSIDHNIIANCSTQFYGRANSPTAIDVIREQLSQRGGNAQDIAKLQRGQFYVASEGISPPIKVLAPFSLSYHPSSPLGEEGVLARAASSVS